MMVDIHNHMLPGIDDGAFSMEEALEMARIAVGSDVRAVVVTPHCNGQGSAKNYFNKNYLQNVKLLQEAVRSEGIPLQICPGMEVFVTYDLPELIRRKKIMTLNHSRYLLVEFGFDEDVEFADYMLEQIMKTGVVPVVAHIERYPFIQDHLEITYQWCEKGYVLQANKSSFMGRFGRRAKQTVYYLMDRGRISVIASDAHGMRERTPYMRDVYEELLKYYSEAYLDVLFRKNPQNICNNLEIIR